MSDGPKYRQRGYKDSERDERPRQGPQGPREKKEGPRGRGLGAPSDSVFRCAACGEKRAVILGEEIPRGRHLREVRRGPPHLLQLGANFDTSVHWECRKHAEIPARVAKKRDRERLPPLHPQARPGVREGRRQGRPERCPVGFRRAVRVQARRRPPNTSGINSLSSVAGTILEAGAVRLNPERGFPFGQRRGCPGRVRAWACTRFSLHRDARGALSALRRQNRGPRHAQLPQPTDPRRGAAQCRGSVPKGDLLYLGHLDVSLQVISKIQGVSRQDFDKDENLRLALTHLIQMIGEAARRVSEESRRRYPLIPWTAIIGMRHKVVHDYLDIDFDVVWAVATVDLQSWFYSSNPLSRLGTKTPPTSPAPPSPGTAAPAAPSSPARRRRPA